MSIEQVLPYTPLLESEKNRIDSVRGFLCFYIFCFHFYASYLEHAEGTARLIHALLFEGHVAVQIFFSISGFLITYSFVKDSVRNRTGVLWRFFTKRAFRIFPAWFVTLLIYSVYRRQFHVGEFFWNFFFIFGLRPFRFEELTALHSWSLYIEELFYISFPFFVFCFLEWTPKV